MTRRRARSTGLLVVALGTIALLAVALLDVGTAAAGTVSGNAGPIAVTVTAATPVVDGESVNVSAHAPNGIVIYEIRAHLCVPGRTLRSNTDFGFQGRRCTNVAVGNGDVEQSAAFPNGVATGSLDSFKVGAGSVGWVNELGYPNTITCGPGHPCDLVVRVEITDNTVFFTAPLCYDASCPAGGDGGDGDGGGTPTSTRPSSPAAHTPTTLRSSSGPGGAGSKWSGSSGPKGAASKSSSAGNPVTVVAPGDGARAGASVSAGTPGGAAASTGSKPSSSHVLIAGLAGVVAGGWIVSIFMRGEGWVAFAIARRRRHRAKVSAA